MRCSLHITGHGTFQGHSKKKKKRAIVPGVVKLCPLPHDDAICLHLDISAEVEPVTHLERPTPNAKDTLKPWSFSQPRPAPCELSGTE